MELEISTNIAKQGSIRPEGWTNRNCIGFKQNKNSNKKENYCSWDGITPYNCTGQGLSVWGAA